MYVGAKNKSNHERATLDKRDYTKMDRGGDPIQKYKVKGV